MLAKFKQALAARMPIYIVTDRGRGVVTNLFQAAKANGFCVHETEPHSESLVPIIQLPELTTLVHIYTDITMYTSVQLLEIIKQTVDSNQITVFIEYRVDQAIVRRLPSVVTNKCIHLEA